MCLRSSFRGTETEGRRIGQAGRLSEGSVARCSVFGVRRPMPATFGPL